MKIKIPANHRATRVLAIRLAESEYKLIADKAQSSSVKPSTLARIVLVQVLKAGIEVN